jgi:hypothetical protein
MMKTCLFQDVYQVAPSPQKPAALVVLSEVECIGRELTAGHKLKKNTSLQTGSKQS